MKGSDVIKQRYEGWQKDSIDFLHAVKKIGGGAVITLKRSIIYEEPHLVLVGLNEEGAIIENTYQFDNQFTVALTELSPLVLVGLISEIEDGNYSIDEEIGEE